MVYNPNGMPPGYYPPQGAYPPGGAMPPGGGYPPGAMPPMGPAPGYAPDQYGGMQAAPPGQGMGGAMGSIGGSLTGLTGSSRK